jgi:hypothetical protein
MQAACVYMTSWRTSWRTSVPSRRPAWPPRGHVQVVNASSVPSIHTISDLLDKNNGARVRVVVRTSIYISSIGVAALIRPGLVVHAIHGLTCPAFGAVIDAVFVRLGGLLAMLFGIYYAGAALDDLDGCPPMRFYRSTVIGRLCFAALVSFVFIAELVVAGQLHFWLLFLGGMNAVSAQALARQLDR